MNELTADLFRPLLESLRLNLDKNINTFSTSQYSYKNEWPEKDLRGKLLYIYGMYNMFNNCFSMWWRWSRNIARRILLDWLCQYWIPIQLKIQQQNCLLTRFPKKLECLKDVKLIPQRCSQNTGLQGTQFRIISPLTHPIRVSSDHSADQFRIFQAQTDNLLGHLFWLNVNVQFPNMMFFHYLKTWVTKVTKEAKIKAPEMQWLVFYKWSVSRQLAIQEIQKLPTGSKYIRTYVDKNRRSIILEQPCRGRTLHGTRLSRMGANIRYQHSNDSWIYGTETTPVFIITRPASNGSEFVPSYFSTIYGFRAWVNSIGWILMPYVEFLPIWNRVWPIVSQAHSVSVLWWSLAALHANKINLNRFYPNIQRLALEFDRQTPEAHRHTSLAGFVRIVLYFVTIIFKSRSSNQHHWYKMYEIVTCVLFPQSWNH